MLFHTRQVHTLTIADENGGDDIALPITFVPAGNPLVHRAGDKIAVAYLIEDSGGYTENPMENYANGAIYTRPQRYGGRRITDNDSEVYSALGLNGRDDVDIDQCFPLGDESPCLLDLAMREFKVENPHLDLDDPVVYAENECDLGDWAVDLYPEHWQDIAGPYVVPVSYWAERGETMCSPTTWDGDPDNLPDGVWVADKEAIENITPYPAGVTVEYINDNAYAVFDSGVKVFAGLYGECKTWIAEGYPAPGIAELRAAAVKYAESVLKVYSAWASGECFGCTVELFECVDGKWIEAEGSRETECWGFIGRGHAEETLKSDFFGPAVKELETAAAV